MVDNISLRDNIASTTKTYNRPGFLQNDAANIIFDLAGIYRQPSITVEIDKLNKELGELREIIKPYLSVAELSKFDENLPKVNIINFNGFGQITVMPNNLAAPDHSLSVSVNVSAIGSQYSDLSGRVITLTPTTTPLSTPARSESPALANTVNQPSQPASIAPTRTTP